MTVDEARTKIAELTEAINRNDRLYYVEARPVIADADYDRMYEELIGLEKQYPQFKDPNSPTLRVSGAPIEGFAQVRHDPPMKSLDKCYEKKDLEQFDAMLRKEFGVASYELRVGDINPQPTTHNPQPTTHNPQPTTHNPQPTTHNPQPTTHNPQPTTHNPQPTTHNPQPTTHNPQPFFHYVVEPKIDGVSMSLLYEDRKLVRAATRGNGEVGDDVTQNVRTIRSIPKTLPDDAPATLEVRGEVYMTRDGFVRLNAELDEQGKPTFMNPRNACAGSLKQLDPKVVATRPLDIVIYNAGGVGCDGFASHTDMIAAFRRWGFPVAPWSKVCDSLAEAIAAIDALGTMRHEFRFEIDGAVMKVNERVLYANLGATAHSPRWARAYKYAPERAETILRAITVQVGRTGVLTPVAELEPVELAGSVISRATLHNADQVAEQDIRVGDHVWLVKAGDVIPAIDGVIVEKRKPDAMPFAFPTRCPVCGGEVVRAEGEVAIRCVNPGCPAQLQRRLEHFASRNALDLSALGGKIADIFVEKNVVKDPLDLFALDWDAVRNLDVGEAGAPRKFGKNAENLRDAVARARGLTLDRWLFAIGIPQVGVTVAKDIAAEHEKFGDLPESAVLKNVIANDAKKGKDHQILQIKVEAAKAVLGFFASDYGRGFLARMQSLGIDPKRAEAEKIATTGPLVGAGCVLTGSLSRPRTEYAKLIERAGGIVQNAVTSKTKYLIAGANVGATKTEKARALGTEVIDEARLLELLGSGADANAQAKAVVPDSSLVQGSLF